MECGAYTLSQHSYGTGNLDTQPYFSNPGALYWIPGLQRLILEREVLENNLADCVTYLQVLRKKQGRLEHRLATDASTTHKSQKKKQQSNRRLKKDIAIREQEQSVLLNNLQVCKAKIYAAETISSTPRAITTEIPFFTPGWTSSNARESLMPTEINWHGWAEDAATSAFTIPRNDMFMGNEIPPNGYFGEQSITEALDTDTTSLCPLQKGINGLEISVPVSRDASTSGVLASILSPKAKIFKPRANSCVDHHIPDQIESKSRKSSTPEPQVVQLLPEVKGRRATHSAAELIHPPIGPLFGPTSNQVTTNGLKIRPKSV